MFPLFGSFYNFMLLGFMRKKDIQGAWGGSLGNRGIGKREVGCLGDSPPNCQGHRETGDAVCIS